MTGAQIASSPRLKRSTFSFIGGERRGTVGSSLKAETTSLDVSLQETNRILVEIQKQLSLDFANRITEKRQALRASKIKVTRERVGTKEKAIESVRQFGSGIMKTFDVVTSPAKSIFQKILDFFSIIVTGLLVNNAFKWLENPANQQKLAKFFKFVANHWKELLALYGAYKLLKIVSALKRIVDLFKRPPKPPGGGKPGGGGGPSGGGPAGGGCGPVLNCIKDIGGAAAEKLAETLKKTRVFSPLFGLIPRQKPVQQPVQQPGQKPKSIYGDLSNLPPGVREDLLKGGQTKAPGVDALGLVVAGLIGALASGGALTTATIGGLWTRLSSIGIRGPKPVTPPPAPAASGIRTFTNLSGKQQVQYTPEQIQAALRSGSAKPSSAQNIIDIVKQAKSTKLPIRRSLGGTVGGTGSGSVDSVPAMLAPGEEVIRASAAMMFRPLLKDINNNAGRMWTTFSDAVGGLVVSNSTMKSALQILAAQLTTFKGQLDKFVNEERVKKTKEIGNGGYAERRTSSNMVSPELVLHSDIKRPVKKSATSSIVPINLPSQTLPMSGVPQYSAAGGVETEEPSVSSVNMANPYMQIVPEMLGIFV
jgi:hypothetical protein